MARGTLRIVELGLQAGLVTRFSAQQVAGKVLVRCDNMDGFEEFGSLGKLPGSTRKSDVAPGPVVSIEPLQYFDAAGTPRCDVVALAGGNLYRVETSKALTLLRAGLTSEPLTAAVTALNRLHLSSPGNDPLKFDGTSVTRWGVTPPGGERTAMEPFDSAAGWSANGTNTVGTSPTSQDGNGSLQGSKLDTSTNELVLTKTGLALNFLAGYGPQAFVFLFLPPGSLTKLATSGLAAEVILGDGTFTNASHFGLPVGELVEGWNLFPFTLASPDSTDGTGAPLSAVAGLRVRLAFDSAGATHAGFLWDGLFVTDPGVAVPVDAGVGGIIGNVSYRVTYLSRYGQESNAGPPSLAVNVNGRQIALGAVPTSPDPQVIARRIYRDLNGDAQYQLVTQLDDNTTTSFLDNVPNAGRSSQTPPLAGDAQLDFSPPPRLLTAVLYKGYVFGINAANRAQLEISSFGRPEVFPIVNRKLFDEELIRLEEHMLGLYIHGRHVSYLMTGETLSGFRFPKRHPRVGITGPRAASKAKTAIFGWHDEGPYLFDGVEPWYAAQSVRDLFENLSPAILAGIFTVYDRSRFRMLSFLQSTPGGAYDLVLSFGYGRGPGAVSESGFGVNPHDLRQAVWSRIRLPAAVNPLCASIVERERDLPEIWLGCSDGYVYRLQDPAATDYAVGSSSQPVAADVQTAWVALCDIPEGTGEARYLGVGGESFGPSRWGYEISLATSIDGQPLGSVTGELDLPGGHFAQIVPLPRAARAGAAQVRLTNARAGERAIFDSVQIHVLPRAFRGARAA